MTISGDTTVEASARTRASRTLVAAVVAGAVLIAGGVVASVAMNQPPLDPRTVAAPSGFTATDADWGCTASSTSACWTSPKEPSELRAQVAEWIGADRVLRERTLDVLMCGTLAGELVEVLVEKRVTNAQRDGQGAFVVPPGLKPVRDGSVMNVYTGSDLNC